VLGDAGRRRGSSRRRLWRVIPRRRWRTQLGSVRGPVAASQKRLGWAIRSRVNWASSNPNYCWFAIKKIPITAQESSTEEKATVQIWGLLLKKAISNLSVRKE
jgi:hypothetical protein